MIISMESEQGGLNMPKKEDTKSIWWDGKQVNIDDFIAELGLEKDCLKKQSIKK